MNKKIISLAIIGTLLIILIATSLSYALWTTTNSQNDENIVETDCFNVNLISNSSALSVVNDFPRIDEDGIKRDPYSFSITNTCETDASYKIKIELQSTNTLPSNLTKVALNNKIALLGDLDNENNNYFIIEESFLEAGETKSYDFRQWVDESGTLENSQNKRISTKIVLESTATVIPPTATKTITNLLNSGDNSLVNDDPDQNIRYVGADPNNYVLFNGQLWRIIGSFNNIKTTEEDDGETRLKIIGPQYYENSKYDFYTWSYGNNDWSTAFLKEKLNDQYYNSLPTEVKSLIDDTVWNLGGTSENYANTPQMFYAAERGTVVSNENPTTWTGKIALIYPSDYGYATGGGTTKNRETCLAKELDSWNLVDYSDCINNNYLFNSQDSYWTLTHDSDFSAYVFTISFDGHVGDTSEVNSINLVNPVLYLKSEVEIMSGSGTNDDPYILGL